MFFKVINLLKIFWKYIFLYTIPLIQDDNKVNNVTLILSVVLSVPVLFLA